MGHPLAGSCVALNIIRSIAHDQPQQNFKYIWLDFGLSDRNDNRIETIRGSLEKSESCCFLPNRKSAIENRKYHLMTLSARANTFGGIVRPICLAAFRLMTNSNFIGCSTGRSAGLTPLR